MHLRAKRLLYALQGDFFKAIPVPADCFAMKYILHDWSDAECVTILQHVLQSLQAGGRVVVLENVVPAPGDPKGDPDGVAFMDVNMMVSNRKP